MFRKIILLAIFLLLLTGCFRKQLEESKLREDVGSLLKTYQRGVNSANRELLETIISSSFSFYQIRKSQYIQSLLAKTTLINSTEFSEPSIENYKIFVTVKLVGTRIYKPDSNIPLFQGRVPFLEGEVKRVSLFALAYERDGLKLLAEDPVLTEEDFTWGPATPKIINPAISQTRANPGDNIEVSFEVTQGSGNDAVFVIVNKMQLGGYSLSGYDPDNEVNYTVKVPGDFPVGEDFVVELMAFAGKANLLDPTDSILQGIAIKRYAIPIR